MSGTPAAGGSPEQEAIEARRRAGKITGGTGACPTFPWQTSTAGPTRRSAAPKEPSPARSPRQARNPRVPGCASSTKTRRTARTRAAGHGLSASPPRAALGAGGAAWQTGSTASPARGHSRAGRLLRRPCHAERARQDPPSRPAPPRAREAIKGGPRGPRRAGGIKPAHAASL